VPSGTFICKKCAHKKFQGVIKELYYLGTAHYSWKGIDTLFQTLLKEKELLLHFIGPISIEKIPFSLRKRIKIYGWKSLSQIHQLLSHAQIGVLPNSKQVAVSYFYTSPMKLLDYMATKTAIAAADLPSIRELISEKEALFFEPDDPSSLREALKILSQDAKLRNYLASNAYQKARAFSWEKRAEKLINFFKKIA